MMKTVAKLLSIVILLVMVAGCASPAPTSAPVVQATTAPAVEQPTAAPQVEPTQAPQPEPTAAPVAEKRTDLVIAISEDIATLHPTDHTTSSEIDIETQIYDTLYKITLDGSTDPEPRIATSYEISEDGLTYTFKLREDATFHDGTPITADDVKLSADLYQASKFQSAKVAGLKETKVIDAHTIAFTTETVYSPFLENVMDMHIASKNYHDTASAEDFANKPVGSGPYKFVSHDMGSKVTLEAFDGYYMGAPEIKSVVYKIIPDNTTVAVALQTGEVDFADIAASNYSNLEGKEGITIDKVPLSRFGFASVNHEKEPFKNVKFRQAIAYAIDRQNMVDLALDGFGTVNSNILSPLRFGWSADQPEYTYDPEKSKALLAEIGIQTPYDLGVLYVAEKYSTQAQVLQADLANVGLNVTIEILEFNAYLAKLMGGEVGITVLEMSLEGATQEYELAFGSAYIGGANNARYNNPDVEAMFAEAVTAVDEKARFDIYNKLFTKVQEDAVYIVMYNTEGLYAHSSKLKVHPFALEGRYYVAEFAWE